MRIVVRLQVEVVRGVDADRGRHEGPDSKEPGLQRVDCAGRGRGLNLRKLDECGDVCPTCRGAARDRRLCE